MSCIIKYNDKNNVIDVLDKSGKSSKLFKSIISNPLLSFDQALSAYKNVFSEKFASFEEEPKLTYRTPSGEIYTTYAKALENTVSGEIKGMAEGIELFSVNSSTNINSFGGQINDFIRDGLLTGVQYLDADGKLKHEVAGNSLTKKSINSMMILKEARRSFGVRNVKQYNNGDFSFIDGKGKLLGEISIKEVMESDPKELVKQEHGIGLLAYKAHNESSRAFSDMQETETIEFVPEDELQVNLMNLLNNLGIKTMSISDYVFKYKTKNGVEPSAQALADIANKVIAFKDGLITPEELTEEVSHFIVEAWNQEDIDNILRNIHRTKEWTQFADIYREIYSKEYIGEELEQAIRREVLGKILANSLQARFQQETENQTESSIVKKVFQLFSDFMDRVSAFFRPEYQTQLNKLNTQVYQNLMQGDLQQYLDENNFKDNRFRLYSTSNPIESKAEALRRVAEQGITLLEALNYRLNSKDPSVRKKIDNVKESVAKIIGKDADGNITVARMEKIAAVTGMVSIVQNQIKYLNRAVNKNKGKSFYLSQEDLSVYTSLSTDFATTLNTMKTLVKGEKELENMLEETSIQLNELQGEIGANQIDALDRLVREYAEKASLTEEQEEDFKNAVKGIQTDTNWIFATVGQMVNSQNAILSLASDITSRVTTEHRVSFQNLIKPFLNSMGDFDITKLNKFKRGNYLENIHDNTKIDNAIADKKYKLYIEEAATLTGDTFKKASELTKEDYEKALKNGTLPELPEENAQKIRTEFHNWEKEEFLVSPYTQEELDRRENKYSKYSETLREFEENANMEYSYIVSKADKVDGRVVLDRQLKFEIENLKKNRFIAKNIFASDGVLKKGLDYVTEEGEDTVKIGKLLIKINRAEASNDALLAFELNHLDAKNAEEFKSGDKTVGGTITEAFKEHIATLSEEDAIEFLMLNSYIGFSQEYYDSFDDNKTTLVGTLQKELDKTGNLEIERLIKDINVTSVKISNIMKANRTLNQPSEINYEGMSKQKGGEVDSVRLLQEELQSYYKEAYRYLPKEQSAQLENSISESSVNDAYQEFVMDAGVTKTNIPEFLRLIQDHVTTRDWNRILDAQKILNKGAENIPNLYKSIFKSDYEGMSKEDIQELMTDEFIEYVESRLLPYFKRTTPVGFVDVIADLKRGDITIDEFIENYENGDYNSFLTITPNTSFQDAVDNSKKNIVYETNKKNNTPQYRVRDNNNQPNKYLNQEYIDKYGIEINVDGTETATKNLEDYKIRQNLIDLQKKSLEALGELDRHNIYKLPQMEKSRVRKLQDTFSKGGVKRFVEEFTNFREDEMEFGQTAKGDAASNAYLQSDTVPKYGLRDLSEKENVSDELFTSYIWMAQQALLYKSRIENIPDMLALRDSLLRAKFGDKKAESSQVFRMFEANLKYNFFGTKESIDNAGQFEIAGVKGSVGAIVNSFVNWISFVNLGYAWISPMTSFLTGGVQLSIERAVGERLDKDSRFLADKEMGRLAPSAIREVGNLKSTSKLNVLGDAFGINDMDDRFQNSNFGKFGRVMLRSGFAMHTIGNFPIIPRVMLSVLYDHKIVNGQMLNYRQYKLRNPDKKEDEVRKDWKAYTSVYEIIDVKDGVMEFNKQKLADLRGTNTDEDKFIKNIHNVLSNRIKIAANEIDGSINAEDKSIMARNSYFRALGLHRNWLVVGLQKRFKSRQLNSYSGTYESGVYTTLPRLINTIVADWRKNKLPFIESVKENWAKTWDDPSERANLKRMLIEMGIINGLIGLTALATNGIKDDDEDSYLEVLNEYLLLRTSNEMISSTIGIGSELYNMLETPIVGLDKLSVLGNASDAFNTDIVTKGKFKGLTESNKYFFKNFPIAKEYFNTTHLSDTRNTYRYWNIVQDKRLDWTIYPWMVTE